MVGYKYVRWCWLEVSDQCPILIALGEYEMVESLRQVWQKKEMLAGRDGFYHLFLGAKVSRRVLQVFEG